MTSSCATTETSSSYFYKDPDSVLDYKVDWTAWMAEDDTIVSSAWIVPTGISKTNEAHTDTTATIWLSGGTLGETYAVVNRITTAQGRTEDRTLTFTITDL